MKFTPKAKLNLVILFVTLYMFAAFFWWTFSLVQYGHNEKALQMDLLRTDSIHVAGELTHNMIHERFVEHDSMPSYYQGKVIYTDTTELRNYVLNKFPNYDIRFFPGKEVPGNFKVFIKKSVVQAEILKFKRRQTGWISEGVTMGIIMLLIALAMFIFLNRILSVNQQQNNF